MGRRWGVVWLLFAASMINYLDRASLSLALPGIARELHLSPTTKGLLLSAFFWSYAIMQIPVGLCVDRFPIRWFYAGMFAIWSLACGLTGLARNLAQLVGVRIMLGIGESIYLAGGSKTVALLFKPQERGLPSGLFDCGTRVGLVSGGIIIPWLILTFGWRRMFMALGFGALVWLGPWVATVPGRLLPSGTSAPPSFHVPAFHRNLLGICLGFFCFDYYVYLLLTWLPDYLVQARHLTISQAGAYSAIPYVVFAVGQGLGGWLGDRLISRGCDETRTRKTLVAFGFAMGLLLIPAVHASSAGVAIAFIAGASLVGVSVGNLTTILQSCAPAEDIGAWTGIENFFGNLAGVLAPLVTGILITRTGSYAPGFTIAGVVVALGILPYWFVVGELKPAK
jgi:MFS family permease